MSAVLCSKELSYVSTMRMNSRLLCTMFQQAVRMRSMEASNSREICRAVL